MPTGPKYIHSYDYSHDGIEEHIKEVCRCMIGEDHDDSDELLPDEAEDIWFSSGMDKDYDFR